MKELHQLAAATDKYEHISILHATSHTFMHHTTQGTDAFTHIGSTQTQEVAHCIIQAEHGRKDKKLIIGKHFLPYRHQAGHEHHWGSTRLCDLRRRKDNFRRGAKTNPGKRELGFFRFLIEKFTFPIIIGEITQALFSKILHQAKSAVTLQFLQLQKIIFSHK